MNLKKKYDAIKVGGEGCRKNVRYKLIHYTS